jgi:hypothetical protein
VDDESRNEPGRPGAPPAPEPFEARCGRLGLPAAEDVAAAWPQDLPALLAGLSEEQLDALHVREVNAHDRMMAESKDRLRAIRKAKDQKVLLSTALANQDQLGALLDYITDGDEELKARLREAVERVRREAGQTATTGPESPPEPPAQTVNAPGAPGKGK